RRRGRLALQGGGDALQGEGHPFQQAVVVLLCAHGRLTDQRSSSTRPRACAVDPAQAPGPLTLLTESNRHFELVGGGRSFSHAAAAGGCLGRRLRRGGLPVWLACRRPATRGERRAGDGLSVERKGGRLAVPGPGRSRGRGTPAKSPGRCRRRSAAPLRGGVAL